MDKVQPTAAHQLHQNPPIDEVESPLPPANDGKQLPESKVSLFDKDGKIWCDLLWKLETWASWPRWSMFRNKPYLIKCLPLI